MIPVARKMNDKYLRGGVDPIRKKLIPVNPRIRNIQVRYPQIFPEMNNRGCMGVRPTISMGKNISMQVIQNFLITDKAFRISFSPSCSAGQGAEQ